jgi:hypothetical protein
VVSVKQTRKRDRASLLAAFESKRIYVKKLLFDCDQYELGSQMREEIALDISGKLRNLLLDRGRQTSLLSQLNYKDELYFESKMNVLAGANNICADAPLFSTVSSQKGLLFKSIHERTNGIKFDFESWWTEIVFDNKEDSLNFITRKEIVIVLADKEEAHTDAEYEKKYDIICNNNGMKLYQDNNGVIRTPANNPYKESVITIAHELIDALDFREIIMRYPFRFICSDDIRYIATEYKVSESEKGEIEVGHRYKRWLSGENEVAFLNIISFDYKSHAKRSYGRCSQVQLRKDKFGQKQVFPLISQKTPIHEIHFFFDVPTHIFIVFYEEDGKYIVVSGSKIGNKHSIEPICIRPIHDDLLLINDTVFETYGLMRLQCGIPPELVSK